MKYKIDPKVTKQIDDLLHELAIATSNMGKDSNEKDWKKYHRLQGKIQAKIEAIDPEFAKIIDEDNDTERA
jgi:hypothetical protein